MAKTLGKKYVVQHLVNGTLSTLCLTCLQPLEEDNFESIFTLICKEEAEYCVADALGAVCQFQFEGTENHNICVDCFKSASAAYKFYLQAKQSMEMIVFYTDELTNHLRNVKIAGDDTEKLLFLPLPDFVPQTGLFNFNFDAIGKKRIDGDNQNDEESNIISPKAGEKTKIERDSHHNAESNKIPFKEEYEITIVKEEKDLTTSDFNELLDPLNSESDEEMLMIINEKKTRKKRDPMVYMPCSRCPVKYRFISKLKNHMKTVHDIDIYVCKICKLISEQKEEYENHIKTHRGKFQCTICNVVYKKADTLAAHKEWHEAGKDLQQSENLNICELCGAILEDEESLQQHISNKHVKKFTCYYCGKMYKGEGSFESHIKKHEGFWNKKYGTNTEQESRDPAKKEADKSKRSICQTCGKDFVDERSLLWHQRLHNDDRPYTCDVCGRGFVSKNRRNQHSLCAHTPPARRCPLCPALFHLRSMVNTHLKKVHLKAHKRRSRTWKHQNVFWRTEPVPIQELSVDLQHDILELQATQADEMVLDQTPEERNDL